MKRVTMTFLTIVGVVLLAYIASSCSGQKRLTQVEYIHDTTIKTTIAYDSIDRWHTHYEYVSGDTIRCVDTFYCDRWHQLRDTTKMVEVQYRDVEREVAVEKELTWWQQCKMKGFWLLLAGIVVYVLWRTRKKWEQLFSRY